MGKEKNIRNLESLGLQTNSLIPVESSSDEDENNVIQYIGYYDTALEPYQEPSQASKIEFSVKIVNDSKLNYFLKILRLSRLTDF